METGEGFFLACMVSGVDADDTPRPVSRFVVWKSLLSWTRALTPRSILGTAGRGEEEAGNRRGGESMHVLDDAR